MIIVQTPLRISFLGGGTDFYDFYSRDGGCVLSSAIDKYVFVIVKERFDRLVEQQNRITFEHNQSAVGNRAEVLVEGPSRRDPLVATTRTGGNRIVHVAGTFRPGSFLDVRITRAAPHYLEGELV